MTRILFIFSKFSPDISYVQGMNEILAPIYYAFSYNQRTTNDDNEYDIDDVEADTFWCFYNIMQKLKCLYSQDEDDCVNGINGKGEKLKECIKVVDQNIYNI